MRSSHPRSWALKLWDPQQFSRPGAAFSAINAWGHKVAPAPLPQGQELRQLELSKAAGALAAGDQRQLLPEGHPGAFQNAGPR